jgi:hypothetical protein
MNQKQTETIVIECRRLAFELNQKCAAWLHTRSDKRDESVGFDLSKAADDLYTHMNNFPEIMGSDTGKCAFDEFFNEDFEEDFNSIWDQPEPDFREK